MRKIKRWTLFALVCLAALGIWRERHGAFYWPFHGGWSASNSQVATTQADSSSQGTDWEAYALLVNAWNPLPDGYQPGALVNLYEQKHSFLLASSDILLEKNTYEAANEMFYQAELDGVNGFIITSGYRTREEQEEIYAQTTDGTAAVPGTSEHETGLAFDVTAQRDGGGFEETPQFDWLIENCWEFGFILRYPEGAEASTGIAYEPWHYRYVGKELAQAIHEQGCTLEEYLSQG